MKHHFPFSKIKKPAYGQKNYSIRSVLLTIACMASPMVTLAQDEAELGKVGTGLGYRFIILIIAFVIAWITRIILIKMMNRLMMKKAKNADGFDQKESHTEEHKAKSELVFKEYDRESELKDALGYRQKMTQRAVKGLNRLFFTDLAVIVVYAIVGRFSAFGDLILDPQGRKILTGYFLFLFLLLVWNVMRIIGQRHQFRAYHKGVFGFIRPLWKILFSPFQTRWCLAIAFIVMVNAFVPAFFSLIVGDFETALPLLLALSFHLFLLNRLKVTGRKKDNLKLLILRVFLINKTSYFTFRGMARFWKHFGSYFTITDPSFYRVHWKKKFNHNFPIFLLVVFFLFTKISENSPDPGGDDGSLFAGFVALIFIGAIFYIGYSLSRMKRRFVQSENQLQKRIAKLDRWPVKYDNTFKEFPVMCYDNTWKMGVHALVHTADVILMDLRGFSNENKGCEFEVNFLFDEVRADRIVFLAYENAVPLIKEMISRQWELLATTSPNLNLDTAETILFTVKKEDDKEIQGILDLLLETALRDN